MNKRLRNTWCPKGWPNFHKDSTLICIIVMGRIANLSWFTTDFSGLGIKVPHLRNPSVVGELRWLFTLLIGEINKGILIAQMRWHQETWWLSRQIHSTSAAFWDKTRFGICPALGWALCPYPPPRHWHGMLLMHWLCHFLCYGPNVCLPPTSNTCWSPNSQCDGIWRKDFRRRLGLD